MATHFTRYVVLLVQRLALIATSTAQTIGKLAAMGAGINTPPGRQVLAETSPNARYGGGFEEQRLLDEQMLALTGRRDSSGYRNTQDGSTQEKAARRRLFGLAKACARQALDQKK